MLQSVAFEDGFPLQARTRRVAWAKTSVIAIVETRGTVTLSPSRARVRLKTNNGWRHLPPTVDKGLEAGSKDAASRHGKQALCATCDGGCC